MEPTISSSAFSSSESGRFRQIPEKLYFTIGEAAKIAHVKPHVLRFWEQEFPALAPRKDEAGRRVYRRRDLDMVMEIRTLLYEQKFTIAGARQHLAERADIDEPRVAESEAPPVDVKRELEYVLSLLKAVS